MGGGGGGLCGGGGGERERGRERDDEILFTFIADNIPEVGGPRTQKLR